ncbi:MAG: HIT domain-containing protein [Proteobacteria bacterium]|nr:HIT domain-containing protein [Pseudomonadota bacterium]MBU1060156.1 HIT domain-containing protein [Pseudomonadota bacterium]
MKTLWAPWRMEHVLGKAAKVTGCLFEPPGSQPFARETLLLYRDTQTVVLLNRFPYTNGHLLVAPLRHLACISDMDQEEGAAVMQMLAAATRIVRECLRPDGLNVGCNLGEAAGAGIADHLHFHIVPRWEGDHNFMTVLAEIRSVPEHLLTTYDRLLPAFQELLNRPGSKQ